MLALSTSENVISLALPCKPCCHVTAAGHCCCVAVTLLSVNAAVLLLGNSHTAAIINSDV